MVRVKFIRLRPEAREPLYMTKGAAGCDVFACLEKPLEIQPEQRVAIPTGLVVQIPDGFEIQVRPRSGLAFKKGLTVINAPGTIDSDFRGEVMVLMIHLGTEPVTIQTGDRIAQFVIQQINRADWVESTTLDPTARNENGFGSTG